MSDAARESIENSAGGGSAKPWSVGKAIAVGSLTGYLALCLAEQGFVSARQWWQESHSQPVAQMRAEQAWLVGQGLARPRKIAAAPEAGDSNTSTAPSLAGWRPIAALKLADALSGGRVLSREPVISAAEQLGEGSDGTAADGHEPGQGVGAQGRRSFGRADQRGRARARQRRVAESQLARSLDVEASRGSLRRRVRAAVEGARRVGRLPGGGAAPARDAGARRHALESGRANHRLGLFGRRRAARGGHGELFGWAI